MTSYLVKKIVVLAVCVAALLVGYNYFRGNAEEQQKSQEIIGKVKDLSASVVDLLKSEHGKYEKGKYDAAISKIKATFSVLREKATAMGDGGQQLMDKVNELELQGQDLEQQLAALEGNDGSQGNLSESPGVDGSAAESSASDRDAQAEAIRRQILKLNQDAEQLSRDFT